MRQKTAESHIYEVCTHPERQPEHECSLDVGLECPACGQVPA